jgi:acyl-CoA synthetase (AMP-forming)/AMP-acid ligase II
VNIATVLEMAAGGYDNRGAIALPGGELSYAELLSRVRARAGWLRAQADAAGAGHLAYLGLSGPGYLEQLLAAAWAGLPFVPLNYRSKPEELRPLLEPFAPALIVHDPEYAMQARLIAGPADRVLEAASEPAGELLRSYPMDGDALALILHTSGTTSRPKAVLLRHRHLCSYIFETVEFASAAPGETALVCVPPYHIAGVMGVLTPLYGGRRLAFLPQFKPDAWLRVAAEHGVSHAFVVPTMLGRILDELADHPELRPQRLRHIAYGGGPIHRAVVERALELFPDVDFVNAYGLTETSSTVALLAPEDHRAAVGSDDEVIRARLGSVGRPLPGIDIQILGEDGKPLPRGETGVISIAGAQVSAHYHGREAPPDRFATGDLGYLDTGGYLFIAGRSDDVIIRGGENISPGEIEDVLAGHPAVTAAAIVGVPDEEWGQRVVAFLEPRGAERPADSELVDYARRSLAGFKVPSAFMWVEELPRTDTGKIIRTRLRDAHSHEVSS